ncbi:MAG: ATP-binding protein [Clostridia bacterium]
MSQLYEKNSLNKQEIDLTVPLVPDTVRIVRLTVSGIASRMGFSIDEIEDIKVAVAEICNRIITQCESISERCVIKFNVLDEQLKVSFEFEDKKPKGFELFNEDDIFGVSIVNSLVDEVDLYTGKGEGIVTLSISLKEK